MTTHVRINSQKSVEKKTQTNKVDYSVLKVTEEMEICTLGRKPQRAKIPRGIIPYKVYAIVKKAGTEPGG